MPRIFTIALMCVAVLAEGRGGSITFNFIGTVGQVPIDDFGTGIQSGDAITGSFTFDSSVPDAIPDPTSGSYTSTGPAFGMTLTIGPSALMFSESGSLNVGILDTFVDQYTVNATAATLALSFIFQDNSATAFSGDGLPLSPPLLTDFSQRDFHLDQTDIGGNETQVDGTIESLTCGSGCSATPESSSAVLLFSGLSLLGAWRVTVNRKRPSRHH